MRSLAKVRLDHKLDFNDVLIVPQKSALTSRAHVCLSRKMSFLHSRQTWIGVPIISSNMDTITNVNTFNALKKKHYMSCFPKTLNKEWIRQRTVPRELHETDWYMLSCGIGQQDMNNVFEVFNILHHEHNVIPKFLCIDVANGYMEEVIRACQHMRYKLPNTTLVAGNVVTPEGVRELVVKGYVDIVKVGIGSGSVCTTRKVTGVGYPQLSAVLECADAAHSLGAHIISDGGITLEGDVAKAFCAGADFVMIGSMLGGHAESPGEITYENGKEYKIVYGMSSAVANNKYAGGLQWYKAPEGKVVKVPYKGQLNNTLQRVEGGLRSACTYIGAECIDEMSTKGQFIKVHRQYNSSLDAYVISE